MTSLGRTVAPGVRPHRPLQTRISNRRTHRRKACRFAKRCRSTTEDFAMKNGAPFESPRAFFSRARDLMVNGFDLIEELSEVTIEPAKKKDPPGDPSLVKTASYFGSPGAFCEQAAYKLYPEAVLLSNASWGGTVDDILRGDADRAIVPIENYITKRTRILYDLICKYDLHIVDEVFLNIKHNLLVKPGTQMQDIKVITSHIQALFQCEQFIVENFPCARLERINDTAVAAKIVAECPSNEIAAIASSACAERYGLEVMKEGIQDRTDNVTRFAALSRHAIYPQATDRAKTSILFALPEDKSSGTLDSRELHSPLIDGLHQPWNYLFYINLEGSVEDPMVKEALDELKAISSFFRLIGSYKMHARYLEDIVAT